MNESANYVTCPHETEGSMTQERIRKLDAIESDIDDAVRRSRDVDSIAMFEIVAKLASALSGLVDMARRDEL